MTLIFQVTKMLSFHYLFAIFVTTSHVSRISSHILGSSSIPANTNGSTSSRSFLNTSTADEADKHFNMLGKSGLSDREKRCNTDKDCSPKAHCFNDICRMHEIPEVTSISSFSFHTEVHEQVNKVS